jgi:hypothetical protein
VVLYGVHHMASTACPGSAVGAVSRLCRPGFDIALPLTRPGILAPSPELLRVARSIVRATRACSQTGTGAGIEASRRPASGSCLSTAELESLLSPITQGRDLQLFFKGCVPFVRNVAVNVCSWRRR